MWLRKESLHQNLCSIYYLNYRKCLICYQVLSFMATSVQDLSTDPHVFPSAGLKPITLGMKAM